MQHRRLGRTGLNVSAISLGTEYLIDIPRERVVEVIHEAIARGINYFDLFFAQPQFRDNMGAAFKGHRDRVYLTAHLGAIETDGQAAKTREPKLSETYFLDYLKRYDTDYVDVLFVHNIDQQEDLDLVMNPGGLLELASRFRREGKTRFIGFSGHTPTTSLQAVQSGHIDVVMYPISLVGNAVPGNSDLFNACVANDVGLVAMKPFAGGKLLRQEQTVHVNKYLRGGTIMDLEKPVLITPVQCLSYVLAQIGVSTAVPGCKNLDELAAALAYWEATEDEKDFSQIITGFQTYNTGECVYCNHCLPCPSEIDIGRVMRLLDVGERQITPELRAEYGSLTANASDCIQCEDCVERCPFGVEVVSRMEQAEALFS